jgi:hypothetical protein
VFLLLLAAVALYLVPGLAVLQLLGRSIAWSRTERLALACGVSVALPPLCLEVTHLLRIPWTTWTTLGYVAAALIVLALPFTWRPSTRIHWKLSRHEAVLIGLMVIAFLVRLYVIRDLPVGMWGDSYHHTMITQLLVDHRGLFSSWEPYAPLVTFTYHYGFHANAAFFHWLSGDSVPRSVLYAGQIINTATLPLAYVLAARLGGNRTAGLWAAGLTGFVNTQPIYYVNWGRYTQLTGQVILPVVLLCWIEAIEDEHWQWRTIILAGIATACLMLTHYLVTLFAALFICAYLLARIVRKPAWPVVKIGAARTAVIGGVSFLLAVPWLLNILSGYLTRVASSFIDKSIGAERIASSTTLGPITPFYLKGALLALALLGALIAIAHRNWRMALPAIWSQMLILMIVPNIVGLPGAGIINWFTAYIALYLTVIPLAAYALANGQNLLDRWRPPLGYALSIAGLIAATVWGTRWQQRLIEPANQLVTTADVQASAWIRTHTAANARFLVNMFPAYNDTVVVGSDGGWWLPLLAGRATTLPPITYASERSASPGYIKQTNAFAAALRRHPLPSAEGIRLIREAGISFVYCGAHIGQSDPIAVPALRSHPTFRVVYDRDGVVIFAVQPDVSAAN